MGHLWRDILRYVDRMDTHEYLLLLLGAIVIGFFCMRGFGSRSEY
jgi:hypothetical protein